MTAEEIKTPPVVKPRANLFAKGNPGRPKGVPNKLTSVVKNLLDAKAPELVAKVIEKALNDKDKDQALMLKICMERIIPQQRAVEVTGAGGKDLAVKIVVNAVETFNEVRTIDGKRIDD